MAGEQNLSKCPGDTIRCQFEFLHVGPGSRVWIGFALGTHDFWGYEDPAFIPRERWIGQYTDVGPDHIEKQYSILVSGVMPSGGGVNESTVFSTFRTICIIDPRDNPVGWQSSISLAENWDQGTYVRIGPDDTAFSLASGNGEWSFPK